MQTYVFHLRRALEPDRVRGTGGGLVTSGRGYVLRVEREQLDAAVFEDGFTAGRAALEAGRYDEAAQRLRTALDLWRGPVLADVADYVFTGLEAARLEELQLAALEARIDADLALGRHDALTAELERLAGERVLRERLHGQLMLALYRCGRQADALAAHRRVRDLLVGELGIDPGERCSACTPMFRPTTPRWTGAREACPSSPPKPPALLPPGPRPRLRDDLACGRPPIAVSQIGRGDSPAACRPSAQPWRSRRRWPSWWWRGRGRESLLACQAIAWA